MLERRTLVSGDVVAQRYHLQDLVHEHAGSITWRAHDSVLSRSVGLELLRSDDPRADRFLDAARRSTTVSDPRFLRVLDLLPDEQGHHMVVREWARAYTLSSVLAQGPLPSARAAAVVAEVAEALACAHKDGQFHRRLAPRHVLLKKSGAVRVVGLGVATALAPVSSHDDPPDLEELERLDVRGLGKLLYVCLASRWPGGSVDGLRAAPTEHGRELRPGQVRAGIDRELDAVYDRIRGDSSSTRPPLTTASQVAAKLKQIATRLEEAELATPDAAPAPDLVRYDPVVEPLEPPPGLRPPRPRPKSSEPPPPTTVEKGKEQALKMLHGARGLVALGTVGILALVVVIAAVAVLQHSSDDADPITQTSGEVHPLTFDSITDFDPHGDGRESPQKLSFVTDGDPETAWTTSTYRSRADLGGLKDGVGLLIDLGATRQIDSVRLNLIGSPTSLQIFTAPPGTDGAPEDLSRLTSVASVESAGTDVTVSVPQTTMTRYVVVWLTSLPQVDTGEFRAEIAELRIDGVS
ncbi:MAG: protein kinase [Aeromicrobium sp.]|uniref:protein kinase n=1 Tax=Aeromicrobium sp. TaxID=1871063 RepID=UPI0039E39175